MRRVIPVLLVVLAALVAAGCSTPPPAGWQRLWAGEWQLHQNGRQWVRGVDADGRAFDARRRDETFRATVVNTSADRGWLRLSGGGAELEWSLLPGESRALDLRVFDRGQHVVEMSSGVVLGSPRIGRPLQSPRVLVVVLVDTLRADHVRRELMPAVLGHFADGRRYSDASANAPWTLPSVASTFASRGVLDLTSPEGEILGLPEGVDTWATRLDEAGLIGGAVIANYTIHALNGFARGFADFSVPEGAEHAPHPDVTWVVDGARAWLAAHQGEDAFLYLHLMDPHQPYRSHRDPSLEAPDLVPFAHRERVPTSAESHLLASLYAGEVRHVDRHLAPLLDELPEGAVRVLTADHGEALGEHGAWGHGLNLYREALSVPLILAGPGIPAGEEPAPVQLLDLAPTLLELMGVPPNAEMGGRSLLAAFEEMPIVSATFGGGPLRWAWRLRKDKIVLRSAPQPEVPGSPEYVEAEPLPAGAFAFDLVEDPDENAPADVPERLAEPVGEAFAATAGGLVPGLQLLGWRLDAGAETVLELPGGASPAAAWGGEAVRIGSDGDRVRITCPTGSSWCAVSLRPVAAEPVPVELVETRPDVSGVVSGALDPSSLVLPEAPGAGLHLWWNPDRSLVVQGHRDTLQRLRALGYIE